MHDGIDGIDIYMSECHINFYNWGLEKQWEVFYFSFQSHRIVVGRTGTCSAKNRTGPDMTEGSAESFGILNFPAVKKNNFRKLLI